jgi:hypothetical protein
MTDVLFPVTQTVAADSLSCLHEGEGAFDITAYGCYSCLFLFKVLCANNFSLSNASHVDDMHYTQKLERVIYLMLGNPLHT